MEISILEYIVYALIGYSSFAVLIVSAVKEIPDSRVLSLVRVIYLFPGIIALMILASSGINIDVNTVTTNNLIKSINTTQTWTEATTQSNTIILQNPVWSMFHWLLAITLIFYMIKQILNLLTKAPAQGVREDNEVE
uniref:ORF61 n=1 Tax=Nitrosopumilaceae spindle-shaped virus TaxID=3065433 RepID=A0AAT9JAR8_9VIRU